MTASEVRQALGDRQTPRIGVGIERTPGAALVQVGPVEAANFVYAMLREACDRVEAGGDPDSIIATCRPMLVRALDVRPAALSPRPASSP